MKKMPNEGGGTTATAATGRNPYSKEKTCGGREDSNAIADPAKRQKRSAGDDDVLGEALERTKKRTRRSSGPSPAEYDDGPPSRDGGGRLPIFKVFNVGGYDGSVQVPKPSAILFRRTSMIALHTAATPSPRDHRAQPSAAILERQMHLAELLRREDGDAAGCASSTTTAGASRGGGVSRSKVKIVSSFSGGIGAEGGAARTTNVTASSGGNPTSRRNDGRGDFASTFGGVAAAAADDDDDVDGGPAGRSASALERIASARSRFASAVDAREYARARGAVQALEAREESSTMGDKQKNNNANEKKKDGLPVVAKNAIVTSGWSCRSCKKTTPFKPASCIRAGHDVRQRRELKEEGRRSANGSSLGSRKDRLDRHGRDDEEGGLTLGSGLEWSGWRGGFE
jgi:minichromosome maintenance protein 10